MNESARRACLGAAIVVLLSAGSAAQTPARFPTNEDLRHTRNLNEPRLSPDGRFVLLDVTEPTVDGASSHLWLVDIEAKSSRQITFAPLGSKRSESQGSWSPDGRTVYFTANRDKRTQLFRLSMSGGEAEPYVIKIVPPVDASAAPDAVDGSTAKATDPVEVDVSSYALAPNGRTAAIVVRDPETPGEAKQSSDKADANAVDQDVHGTRVYLLDLGTSRVTPIAIAPNVTQVVWSNHSDRLAVVTEPMNNADDLGPANRVWIVDVAGGAAPRQLMQAPPTIDNVVWSPSDTRLFFDAQAATDAPPGYSDLFALTLAGGTITNLSNGQGNFAGPLVAESDDVVISPIAIGTQGGYARFDVTKPGAAPIAFERGLVAQLETNDRRTSWVYLRTDTDQPAGLYLTKALGSSGQRLDTPATAGADWRAVKATVVHWKSDAFTIEGLLYLPPAAASGKVPLVVNVHGGPASAWLESYSPFTQFLLGKGWAVLMPNPRGSTSYGAAFAAANKNDLGGGDYRDIMAGVDFVVANYPIDPARLALFGYSYGGEMAAFVEGKTDRFKAIVSCAPVIDQFSEYGTEDGSWYDRWYFGKPWEHVADAWRQSPLSGVAHAKTPFLLLQGEADTVDPLGQSQEMYRALRQVGVPVQLVTYPRDNHGPLSRNINGAPSPEPWHGFDARQRIAKFFETAFAR